MKTNKEILERHDVSVRPRARMELRIVDEIIKQAKEKGYTLYLYNEDTGTIEESKDIKDEIFNLDEARISVERSGWIYLVLGNSGYDCISDYSVNLEEFLKPVNKVADDLENGLI